MNVLMCVCILVHAHFMHCLAQQEVAHNLADGPRRFDAAGAWQRSESKLLPWFRGIVLGL